jgi:hypothetical protein
MTDTTTPERLGINFQYSPCSRCGGSGMFGPKIVEGGRCFQCKGAGELITRNGARAFKAYRALMAERMGTPVEEIAEGSRVYTDGSCWVGLGNIAFLPWGWRRVHSVKLGESSYPDSETGETVHLRTAYLQFSSSDSGPSVSLSAPAGGPLTVITPNREVQEQIMREVAKRYKAAWLNTEEPPAPPAPRFRKAADVEEPKERPASEGRVKFIRDLVAELPEGNEVRAEAEEALAGELGNVTASGLIDRLLKAKEAARPLPENKFGGKCRHCGAWVEEKQGNRVQADGRWNVQHKPGECAEEQPAKTEEQAVPVELATHEGIYRHGGALYRVRRGPSGHLYAHTITWNAERGKVEFARAPGMARRLAAGERLGLAEVEEISALWDSCALCGTEMTVSKGIGPVCRKRV